MKNNHLGTKGQGWHAKWRLFYGLALDAFSTLTMKWKTTQLHTSVPFSVTPTVIYGFFFFFLLCICVKWRLIPFPQETKTKPVTLEKNPDWFSALKKKKSHKKTKPLRGDLVLRKKMLTPHDHKCQEITKSVSSKTHFLQYGYNWKSELWKMLRTWSISAIQLCPLAYAVKKIELNVATLLPLVNAIC